MTSSRDVCRETLCENVDLAAVGVFEPRHGRTCGEKTANLAFFYTFEILGVIQTSRIEATVDFLRVRK